MSIRILSKLLFIPLVFLFLNTRAARVDTVTIHSGIMKRDIKAVVITPAKYNKSSSYPVVYLLHGFSGNYADWVTKDPAVKALADQYNCLIVCPDGAFASWYIDSPVNKYWMFDTYVSKELVAYVDDHFSTIRNRSGRAITGLSMGGHGAITMGINHQDVYGAMGSMSGCMDLRPYKKDFAINQILGEYDKDPQSWLDHSATGMVGKLKPGALKIVFDCGSDDFFFGINNAFHEQLLAAKIPHDYTVRPGGHTWEYWSNSINYQMLFFRRFFDKQI
ncbi:esterase family protein [Mucilaginibacter achroorhodeus]|uniref:Esterase family protein n=1 Tax=Mucilaginibacter achroorhodeus TaxID=2599294 RepID=A0A563U0T4_9SPHI|nr:alpha/beta hydrolase family protein [Mucilaginibacter achroorhodeus]TWR24622.1 esterase family protein [Mucilaginibacter achroorhodeus]